MPHLILEYTSNLGNSEISHTLIALHGVLLDSGYFEGTDIKSRAIPLDTFLVGHSGDSAAFAHVTLKLLSGRTPEVRHRLAQALLQSLCKVLQSESGPPMQLTVEVCELERHTYAKAEWPTPM